MVREKPRKTLAQYAKYINKAFEKELKARHQTGYTGGAIGKQFERWNVERRRDSKGWFRVVKEPYQPVPLSFIDFLKEVITEEPYILENKDIIIIPTKEHSEKLLCQKMKENFQKHKAVYIPAFECVVVICSNKKDFDAICENIEYLLNGFLPN